MADDVWSRLMSDGMRPVNTASPLEMLMSVPPGPAGIGKASIDHFLEQRRNAPPFNPGVLSPMMGLRREDFTDEPGSAQPQDQMIGGAFDLAGLAMTGGMPMAARGAAGMAGGRLTQMDQLKILAERTTQDGTKRLLGLDKPPPPRSHSEYIAQKTKKMTPEEVISSEALWAMSRDLAAQTNIPMSKAFSDLAEKAIGRPLTAAEFAQQMSEGARYGLLSPRRYGE